MPPQTNHAPAQIIKDDDELSYDESLESIDVSMGEYSKEASDNESEYLQSSVQGNLTEGIGRCFAHWRILLAGQVLSILLALSSAMSASMHFDCNVSAPSMQTALVFAMMSVHCLALIRKKSSKAEMTENVNSIDIPIADLALGTSVSIDSIDARDRRSMYKKDEMKVTSYHIAGFINISCPWWVYAMLALLSAEAAFFTFLAYKYTSLPSASLLDNVNILAAMVGSRILLKRKYRLSHILGAAICCAGVAFNIFSDVEKGNQDDPDMIDNASEKIEAEAYPQKMIGDVLAIVGGLLVGFCDVIVESIVKDHVSIHEYLGIVGFFGSIFAFTQSFFLERNQIMKFFAEDSVTIMTTEELHDLYDDPYMGPRTCTRNNAVFLLFIYMFAQYIFNYTMSRFLKVSESALLTLSLLTADIYAVVFTIIEEKMPPPLMFYGAFVLVVIGVIVYEMSPSPLGYADDLQMENGIEFITGISYRDKNGSNSDLSNSDGHDGEKIEKREIS
uniref:EamA domain-containing protein n=1 Tax=Chaetoceros debilis TaxID=122233 RepID=A0A7S3V4F0_9STRA|mmetsp:Transcript_2385/g.3563  ORF Transcript_2385/g.3563 Transcript_2385/m.3563 type:complete len:503 (-) Transcript_2385:144-1652(-)|eukprot:CAMPEP_0194089482 /NCGR_PEP_ID=MMETSP0149-20130528/34522_1 /TAXON_ID=122233 /ORGANISM="Chaetoceros debilis, Strain MM31A-1" /LENGTH=502 /DNA_ID=CAMNT_0038773431 /DNA_START=30 /DNA_END=1538 /DNA_ORIENTATION=+